jgi:hypothetical protein
MKSNTLKLIREEVQFEDLQRNIIVEEKTGARKFKIHGPFLQAEVKNKNGRIYKNETLLREVGNFQNKIKRGNSYGELDHPPSPTVNGQNVAILITDLFMEGNTGMGTATVLNTVQGRNVQAMMEADGAIGISTRGVGTMTGGYVNNDFRLITADAVIDPSAPDCYVEGILESKDYIIQGDTIVEAAIANFEQELATKGNKPLLDILKKYLSEVSKNV